VVAALSWLQCRAMLQGVDDGRAISDLAKVETLAGE